jgi:hypothetical protein
MARRQKALDATLTGPRISVAKRDAARQSLKSFAAAAERKYESLRANAQGGARKAVGKSAKKSK